MKKTWDSKILTSNLLSLSLALLCILPHPAHTEPLYAQAHQYIQQGRYREAITLYEASLPQARSQSPEQLFPILGNLVVAYRVTGQYPKALKRSQELIQLLEQTHQPNLLSKAWNNLGSVYADLGDYDQAQNALEIGQRLAIAQHDRPAEAVFTNSLGAIAASQGHFDSAIQLYQHSLAIATDLQDPRSQASAWLNLGSAHHAQGKISQAQQAYQNSLAQAIESRDRQLQASALGSLGVVYDSQRQFEQAIASLQQSLVIFQEINDRPNASTTLNNLGHAFYTAGQLTKAEQALNQSLQILDELRQGLSDLDKVSLFDTQAKTYNLLQQVLIAQNQPEAALEISEWGRGRAFADLLLSRHNPTTLTTTPNLPPPNLAELRQVAQDQNATLVEYTLIPPDDFVHQGKQLGIPEAIYIWVITPSGQIHHRQTDLKPLLQKQQSLDSFIQSARTAHPTLFCPTEPAKPQKQPPPSFPSPSPKAGIVVDPVCPPPSSDLTAPRPLPALQQLHQLLIDPIADLLPQRPEQRVVFIPQGSLFLVPFPALQNAQGKFLIERHTLLSAPSIQTLALTQRTNPSQQRPEQKNRPSQSLVVGNPLMPALPLHPDRPPVYLPTLFGAEEEAQQIARTLHVTPLIGEAATEAEVRKRLPQARWIHLATHGLLDYGLNQKGLAQPGIPGAIALASSGTDPAQDGLLTSNEIIDLNLQADLVVLSACDTGRGELTGDGVVGLARAWMGAGTPSVVVSLWAVSDTSTAVLMTKFYQHLSEGQDKAQALRQAMLSTAQTYPDPHDWAAFTLVGSAD